MAIRADQEGLQLFVDPVQGLVRKDGTVLKHSGTGVTAGFTAGTGTAVESGSTFTGNTGSTAYTIGDVVAALKATGILAA